MKRAAILLAILLCAAARADYLGSWKINDYVTVQATTHRFSTGAAYAATGNVLLDIYEADTDEQIVDDTVLAAFDSVTGLYLAKVQLLTATGFEAGKHYTCVIAATVDGVAGICTHQFQILAAVDVQTVETADATTTLGTAQTGDSYAIVNSGTYGNSALKTLIDAITGTYDFSDVINWLKTIYVSLP